MMNLSWFLQSDVQSVISCSVCTHHPQQHEHEPQQEQLLSTPPQPWREMLGFPLPWLHTKVVGCLLSEGLVEVWVF